MCGRGVDLPVFVWNPGGWIRGWVVIGVDIFGKGLLLGDEAAHVGVNVLMYVMC